MVPQVSGTLRSNLDPFGLHDDASLWDALKRAHLVETPKSERVSATDDEVPNGVQSPIKRFTLDSVVEDEGGNLSIGQVYRCCLSLHRYLSYISAFSVLWCPSLGPSLKMQK
jgi:ABC-type multidrug transport system fused ATPase/permease subunit